MTNSVFKVSIKEIHRFNNVLKKKLLKILTFLIHRFVEKHLKFISVP